MSKVTCFCVMACCWIFLPGDGVFAKGYMGGQGDVSSAEEEVIVASQEDDGGVPESVDGPLNDKMADSGKLFGDLFKLLRHHGEAYDSKLVPEVESDGSPHIYPANPNGYFYEGIQPFVEVSNEDDVDLVVGGEPVLTVIDVEDNPTEAELLTLVDPLPDYGWYAAEVGVNADGEPVYGLGQAPYPAQCVQPVADYKRWGDISARTGLSKNRLPLVITYDPTWQRSEYEVGKLVSTPTVDPVTGVLNLDIEEYFIEPGGTWEDPVNGVVTYTDGVLWGDLVGEVHFGRLNIGRSPAAVLQAAFDEAISSINSPDTINIRLDASGRLLLTKNVYDEYQVDTYTGEPLLLGTVEKAIDSPLENIALYVKLMQDGHLVTPADERAPIDRSENSGIPIWKMLELTDGPVAAPLRPTIDIAKMRGFGLDSLVDVVDQPYMIYYQCVDAYDNVVDCFCLDEDPVQPELETDNVVCSNVVDRKLFAVSGSACIDDGKEEDNPNKITCEGPFTGIMTDGSYAPNADDLNFSASFLAAAADKTGDIDVDMVVYLNSILGINKVIGYSDYDSDGNPTEDAIDYNANPVYFNFNLLTATRSYGRDATFNSRGTITVLQGGPEVWSKTTLGIMEAKWGGTQTIFNNIGKNLTTNVPNDSVAETNILGFSQQADDDLSVIEFIHTYQIPELR